MSFQEQMRHLAGSSWMGAMPGRARTAGYLSSDSESSKEVGTSCSATENRPRLSRPNHLLTHVS